MIEGYLLGMIIGMFFLIGYQIVRQGSQSADIDFLESKVDELERELKEVKKIASYDKNFIGRSIESSDDFSIY